jgi:hypothetical protein
MRKLALALLLVVVSIAHASADEGADQLKKLFPAGPLALPAPWSKVRFGETDAELKAAMPTLGENHDCTPAGASKLHCQIDMSYGVTTFRIGVDGVGVDKTLTSLWGKPVVKKSMMGDDLKWYSAPHGLRATLTKQGSDGKSWSLELNGFVESKTLFPKGPVRMPGDLGKATLGMTKAALEKAVPGFVGNTYYDLHKGYEDVRYWYSAEEGKVKELTVSFGGSGTLDMLTAAWGAPKLDAKKRPYWVNAPLRATLVQVATQNDSLKFSAASKGDYSEY